MRAGGQGRSRRVGTDANLGGEGSLICPEQSDTLQYKVISGEPISLVGLIFPEYFDIGTCQKNSLWRLLLAFDFAA